MIGVADAADASGLSHLAQDDPLNGMRELVVMVLTMVSIALGVLTGLVTLAASSVAN